MNRIKELRKELKLTQVELSSLLGVTQATLSGWETGKYEADNESLIRLSELLNASIDYILGRSDVRLESGTPSLPYSQLKGVKIPVLGIVRAGYPIYAEENIIDYEEISTKMAATGEFFALKIKGDSMEPRMFNGDTVIVRKQDYIENGEIAVVLVNGDFATVKKVLKKDTGIMLVPLNSSCSYEPTFYTPKDIETLPVIILGKVVEVRGRV
ncbi:MAG: helix-turn-helix domain-containing protein [Oscillospiraceae bacterium]|nr:helix-turn-helix domain-containing protein [Oscillospiraceae bacterium]